jgi:hypothetical protein
MAGEIASLFISRMAVPVLYYMAYKQRKERLSSKPKPEGDRPYHNLKAEALDL